MIDSKQKEMIGFNLLEYRILLPTITKQTYLFTDIHHFIYEPL